MSTFPVTRVEDLQGRKILAPGPSATWLEGTGAVPVNGGLSTYYTQLSTGVADGVLTILSGAYPYRIHEVAPYITLVGIGAQFNGGVAINRDTWERLPADVQAVMSELGRDYSRTLADEVNRRYEDALAAVQREGAAGHDPAGRREAQVDRRAAGHCRSVGTVRRVPGASRGRDPARLPGGPARPRRGAAAQIGDEPR